MNFTDQLLSALSVYGYPVLFGVVAIASAGVPFPITLMLIVAGSFVDQGEMNLGLVIGLASGGAIVGDQLGYGLGRWGGRRLALKVARKFSGGEIKLTSVRDKERELRRAVRCSRPRQHRVRTRSSLDGHSTALL